MKFIMTCIIQYIIFSMVVGVWGGTFLQDGREYEYSGDMYQNTGPPSHPPPPTNHHHHHHHCYNCTVVDSMFFCVLRSFYW